MSPSRISAGPAGHVRGDEMSVSRLFLVTTHIIINIYQKLCLPFTLELEGFRRPKWAQIEAELCGSDMCGRFLLCCIDTVGGFLLVFYKQD